MDDDARLKRVRKTRDAVSGLRDEIMNVHRLAVKAMRVGDMKALRAALDVERSVIRRFAAILDKRVQALDQKADKARRLSRSKS